MSDNKQPPRETKMTARVTRDGTFGIGTDIAAGVVGGIASGAAGAVVQQGLAKLNGGGKHEPKK